MVTGSGSAPPARVRPPSTPPTRTSSARSWTRPAANKTFADVLADPKGAGFVPPYVAMDEVIDTFSTSRERRAGGDRLRPGGAADGAARAGGPVAPAPAARVVARRGPPDRRGLTPTEVRLRPEPALCRTALCQQERLHVQHLRRAAALMAPNSMAVLWMLSSSAVGGVGPPSSQVRNWSTISWCPS